MNGIPTMSPIFAVFFTIAGFVLAVLLGLVLYPPRKPEKAPSKKSFEVHEDVKAA